MSDPAFVLEALERWPRTTDESAEGTPGRLLAAIRQSIEAPRTIGPWDLAGLVGQFLREEAIRTGNKDFKIRVPTRAPWPDRATWEAHGVQVPWQGGDERQVLWADSWHPEWLPMPGGKSPIDATLDKENRRAPSPVSADPVWAEELDRSQYLSPGQRDAVRAALLLPAGRTLLVVLPTGGGKSLVGQAPTLLGTAGASTTLCIVPTTALALDQERSARALFARRRGARNLPEPFAYHGGLAPETRQRIRDRIADGGRTLVITSPESAVQALRPALFRCASRGDLGAIVVDEAHLVSQWGTEFRPDFQTLASLRRLLVQASPPGKAPRTILLTATLTQDGWKTLRTLFGSPELDLVSAVHLRPEPDYFVHGASDPDTRDARMLEALRFAPRPMILYTSLRREATRWHRILRVQGLRRIGLVHGATRSEDRLRQLEAWSTGAIDCMVATSAFGLGMDKADVRTVLHACVPETLDRYYQEVGRSGRDGRASFALLIHEPEDLEVAQSLNRDRIIGIKKGLLRWKNLFRGAQSSDDGDGLTVSLDSRPDNIRGDSDANVAWNLRTLLLMTRAGLIELEATEPPTIDRREDETDEEYERRQHEVFEKFKKSMTLHPSGRDHQSPATWERHVEPVRRESTRADRRSLEQVERFLRGEDSLADLLVEAYTLDPGGDPLPPQRVDGRCPVSRALGKPSAYSVPDSVVRVEAMHTVGDRLGRWIPPHGKAPLLISLPPGSTPENPAEGLLAVLAIVIRDGLREIRAANGWLGIQGYRSLFRHARPRIVFHTELRQGPPELLEELPVPRLTILDRGDDAAAVLAELFTSPRPFELLFLPEDLPDPDRPDRALLSVRAHVPFSRFRREMN